LVVQLILCVIVLMALLVRYVQVKDQKIATRV